MEDLNKVKEYMNKLLKVQPIIQTQVFISYPCPWINYEPESKDFKSYVEQYGFPNHRSILTKEVVIDVDAENVEDGIRHANMVEHKLKYLKIHYKRYKSGGTGQHFHMIFNSIPKLLNNNYHNSRVKYLLIEFLLGSKILNPKGLDSHICMANKSLIQIEYAKHRKGGVKTLISGDLIDNPTPKGFKEFVNIWIDKRMKIQTEINTIPEPNNLNCIKFLNGKTVNNINYYTFSRLNYRALFALSSYHIRKTDNKEKTLEIILNWYYSIPLKMRNASKEIDMKLIKNTVKHNKGFAGCMYRMDLLHELKCESVCVKCPYQKVITPK